MKKTSSHIAFLDSARGIAILAVFFYHAVGVSCGFDQLPWDGLWKSFNVPSAFLLLFPFTYGWAGVAIFFAVSGFCIQLSYSRARDAGFKSFFVRRFFRIYPPYLVALLIFFFVFPYQQLLGDTSSPARQLLHHIALTHNVNMTTFYGINPSFWSIAVEAQLYALFPLLLYIASKIGWKQALMVCFFIEAGIGFSAGFYELFAANTLPAWYVYSPFAYWCSWSLGAYLADCYLKEEALPFAKFPLWATLLLAVIVPLHYPTFHIRFLPFSLLTVILIARALNGTLPTIPILSGDWLIRPLRFLGKVSYSFYLIHQPILFLVPWMLFGVLKIPPFHPLLVFVVCIATYPLVLFLSWVLYSTVEFHAMCLGRQWAKSV